MSRIRFVKPEFFSDAKLAKVKPVVRLFYIGLFTQADRAGRFIWNEDDLKLRLIAYDRTSGHECLAELLRLKRVLRYGDEGQYGMIINFLKHQYINPREPESKIPAPDKDILKVLYQTDTGILDKGIRNKDKEETASREFLIKIPEKDLKTWEERFDCTKKMIILKGESLYNYCESKNRIYKNYRMFLLNILIRDFPERKEAAKKKKVEMIDGKPHLIES